MRADLMLPYGCRNGACGTCKGKILDGEVDYGAHQKSTLTDDEKRRDSRSSAAPSRCTDLVDRGARGAPRRRHPDQAAAVPHRMDRKGRARRRHRPLQAAGQRAAAIPRRAVHRFPAEGRQAAQLLAGHAAARRQALELHIRHIPAGSSPTRCSRNTRGARSCASKDRSARSTCASNRTSRSCSSRAARGSRRSRRSSSTRFTTSSTAKWCCTGARARVDLYLPDLPAQWQRSNATSRTSPCCRSRARGCMDRTHGLRPCRGAGGLPRSVRPPGLRVRRAR